MAAALFLRAGAVVCLVHVCHEPLNGTGKLRIRLEIAGLCLPVQVLFSPSALKRCNAQSDGTSDGRLRTKVLCGMQMIQTVADCDSDQLLRRHSRNVVFLLGCIQ